MTNKISTAKKNVPSNIQSSTAENVDEHSDFSSGFDFETSFNELEKIVDKLENGQLSLEQSLDNFERGIHLTQSCQNALSNAQQKVQILLEKNDQASLKDYERQ
ncbi:MAG: exodeoxyribonuclease VII small subunit [gamma proteobacterium symbiont of Taylorina sp.]|nr:exodeoxyribonuclease VII small subunit [gamma proteobacterium symbiont of Taylorina sp.]